MLTKKVPWLVRDCKTVDEALSRLDRAVEVRARYNSRDMRRGTGTIRMACQSLAAMKEANVRIGDVKVKRKT
jgi:hypothetical protein